MPPIGKCEEKECGFNRNSKCHAFAITVGGPNDLRPKCDTFFETKTQCGEGTAVAGIGACKVLTCKLNEHLLCRAPNVNIRIYSGEAECAMYKSLGGLRNSSGKPVLSA